MDASGQYRDAFDWEAVVEATVILSLMPVSATAACQILNTTACQLSRPGKD